MIFLNRTVKRCDFNFDFKDFPGGPVVKTLPSNAGDVGSIPGHGAVIPCASWPKKPEHGQQKQYLLKS